MLKQKNLFKVVLFLLFSVYGNTIEINTAIVNANDDVEERSSGRMSQGSSDLEMIEDSDEQTIGLRFVNLDIPQGATVTTAYIQFTADETDSVSTILNIRGEISGNASAFSTTNGDVNSRDKTSSVVVWDVPVWNTTKESGVNQRTPEMKNIVQEIVSQGGWSANNSMVFIVDGSGKRVADSYEGGVDRAPKLHITYELDDDGINGDEDNTTDDSTESSEVTIVDTAVNHDDDDAEELANGDISTGSSDLELVDDGSNQTVGMRFTNLNIPQGATITNAYMKFTTDERDDEPTFLNIYAQKSANPNAFLNVGFNITQRAKTSASVSWSVPTWSVKLESGEKQKTPELKSVVQEVVDLADWSVNSNMVLLIDGSGKRVADSHEGGANRATKLHIEFRVGDSTDDINSTDNGEDNNSTDGIGDEDENNNTTPHIGAITFTEDVLANSNNPDRGLFYGEYPMNEDAGYDVFESVKNKGYILAYATIDLNDYRGSMTLPQSLFDILAMNFANAQNAGVKLILRFKYRVDRSSSLVDPSIEMIEAHFDQLKPFLAEHQDVISVVQAGTIGAWGEWNNFTGDFTDSDSDYKNNRKRVVDKLGELFPNKYIQMRTPMHKELIYGGSQNYSDIATDAKITSDMDFDSNILARLGHHNDCIFANENDYGTYGANDIEFWKKYVADDSKYAPVGGVSCGEMEEQYKTCEYALSYFKGLDYSFIMDNPSSHRVALHDQWKAEGCYSEIVNNLGYRLVAKGLDVEIQEPSNTLDINFSIENSGFASPHVPVPVRYVLKSTSQEFSFTQTDIDIRKFTPNEINSIDASLDLNRVTTGEYCLYLQLGEGYSAIRLSNSQNSEGVNIWSSNDKLNKLICGIAVSSDYNGADDSADSGYDDSNNDGGSDTNTTDGGDDSNSTNGNNNDSNQTVVLYTIDSSINSGSDDIEESESGSMSLGSSDLELVQDGTAQTIGLRFTNLDIPVGATITSAYIQFTTDETRGVETTLLDIYGERVANASLFTTATHNASSRTKTSVSVNWDVPLWEMVNESEERQKTPELKNIVQEIVDMSGWQRNNAMVFVTQGVGRRVADSYEGGADKAPKLHIEYEVGEDNETINSGNKTENITYVEDSSVNVLNPDRGLYTADYSLTNATDWNIFQEVKDGGYAMAFSPIELYDYVSTATLPSSLLDTMNKHLNDAQSLGIKLIIRFKYRPDSSSSYVDPSLDIILGHMEQLKPILQSYKEVISVIQAGAIGAWGEWNRRTGEFHKDTDTNYKDNMRAVVAKLVEIFPDKYVQIRTPMYKELLYGTAVDYEDEGTEGQITATLAFGDDIRAKIGHHNDCLLVDDTNYGTYTSNIDFWKSYVANDSKYSPVGGETCGIDKPALTDCSYALSELKHLQYSYLNDTYHPDVLDKWKSQGCYTEIKENLGYRLVAKSLSFDANKTQNSLDVILAIENRGFASPYVKSNVAFVLKNHYNSYEFLQDNIDMRTFAPESIIDIETSIDTVGVEEGSYCLHMKIGENFSAIRFSNSQNSNGVAVWDDELKMNILGCGIEI